MKSIQPIVLAAGQGTRMKSELPKVLHPVMGKPMIEYILDELANITPIKPIVVVGFQREQVSAAVEGKALTAIQHQQLGTANAVQSAEALGRGKADLILLAYADMPCLTSETIQLICDMQLKHGGAFSMLTVIQDDAHGFGRILRNADGSVAAIVEEAQATPEQLKIRECNVGVYCFESEWMWEALKRVKVSPKGEYYLTDLVELANEDKKPVHAVVLHDLQEVLGINNRAHLSEAEAVLRARINHKWMLAGVTMIDPATVYIDHQSQLDADVTLLPNTVISGASRIRPGSVIGPSTVIENSQIGNGCVLPQVVVRNAEIPDNTTLKPFQVIENS